MPNLFPILAGAGASSIKTANNGGLVKFGRSPRFDYAGGEFVLAQSGKIIECTDSEAWLEWCQKAIRTQRYTHLVYSRTYGQEFEDLIARQLTRQANEMEITRITTETLKADPRTASVRSFTFQWENGACSFQCELTNVRGEVKKIQESVVIG